MKHRYRLRFLGYHVLSGNALWQCYIVIHGNLIETDIYLY